MITCPAGHSRPTGVILPGEVGGPSSGAGVCPGAGLSPYTGPQRQCCGPRWSVMLLVPSWGHAVGTTAHQPYVAQQPPTTEAERVKVRMGAALQNNYPSAQDLRQKTRSDRQFTLGGQQPGGEETSLYVAPLAQWKRTLLVPISHFRPGRIGGVRCWSLNPNPGCCCKFWHSQAPLRYLHWP